MKAREYKLRDAIDLVAKHGFTCLCLSSSDEGSNPLVHILQDMPFKPFKPPVEAFQPDQAIIQALQPQSRPKPLEGQRSLFTQRVEPAKRRRGESNDQQTLF